jgi:single-strand DNA-binding protein
MPGTINKVILIGHTGDEIKMHYFDDNNCLGRLPIATNEEYKNKSTGERVSNTEWHNVVLRNQAAKVCEQYLRKGDKIYIEGRIKTRKWQDNEGNDRYSTEVHCTDFTFLTPKSQSGMGTSKVAESTSQQNSKPETHATPQVTESHQTADNSSVNQPEEDDDLPF